jgi:hypothetical protein
MDLFTFTTISFLVIAFLAFLVNFLFEPSIRKSATYIIYFVFAAILIFSSFKMIYTGEMGSFNVQEGEVKISLASDPLQFLASFVFQLSLGGFILYSLFLKIKKK